MADMPALKVGIISCSGEARMEGALSRIATRLVLEKLRPGKTVTICLPLFLAGGEEERNFARHFPTLAVDGCEKLCAKIGTEKYSGKVADVVIVSDFIKQWKSKFPVSSLLGRENLSTVGEEELRLASRIAEEIALKVDDILEKFNYDYQKYRES